MDDASRRRSFSVIATGLWRGGDSDLVTNEQVLSPLPAERMLIAPSTNMKETVMHVVYAEVGIRPGRTEEAINNLKEDILPRVKQAPGFVKGTWYGNDQTGHSLTLFESEEQAQGMAKMVTAEPDDPIEILEVEVYEVHAEA